MPAPSEIQKVKWRTERKNWIFMVLLIVFTIFILYGFGPISRKSITSVEGKFTAKFQGILRYKKHAPLEIKFTKSENQKNYRIRINKDFFYSMVTDKIVPEPTLIFIDSLDYIYSFRFNNDEDATVAFHLRPKTTGKRKLLIGAEKGIQKEMDIYIYP
jgi:hypothetical protein